MDRRAKRSHRKDTQTEKLRPIAVLVLLAAGCPQCPIVDPPPVANCEIPTAVPTATDACDGSLVAELSVTRVAGPPNVGALTFELGSAANLCIIVRVSANDQGVGTAAAWLSLNDDAVLRPSDFGANVLQHVRHAMLDAGTHDLAVEVAGAPGASLLVELRAAVMLGSEHFDAAEEISRLERLSCEELNDSLDLLGPELVNRGVGILETLGIAPGRLQMHFGAYGVPTYISPLPSLSLAGTNPEETASNWLAMERGIFRMADSRHMLVASHTKVRPDGSARVSFDQFTDGLRVDSARIHVFIDPLGEVRKVVSGLAPDVNPDQPLVVSETEAIDTALIAAGSTSPVSSAELVYLNFSNIDREARVELAYRIELLDPAIPVWIDATDGTVLTRAAEVRTAGIIIADASGPLVDTTVNPPVVSTSCDAGCLRVLDAARLQEAAWIVRGRDGWAGDGNTNISVAPGEPLSMRLDIGGGAWNPVFKRIDLGPAWAKHADVLWHETCHGFISVEAGLTDMIVMEDDALGAIDEHVADTCAILLDARFGLGSDPLVMERFGEPSTRNHGIDECTGYDVTGSDVCDLPAPDSNEILSTGCREYLHLGNFAVRDPSTPTDPNAQLQNGLVDPHLNSCILSRPVSLLLRSTATLYRGITVLPLDLGVADLTFNKLFTTHVTDMQSVFVFGESVRAAAMEADALCLGSSDSPCDAVPVEPIPVNVDRAYAAAGFWSTPMQLDELVNSTGSIGAVRLSNGDERLFFAVGAFPATPSLYLYQDVDGLYDFATPGALFDLGEPTAREVTANSLGLASAVAFTTLPTGEVRVGSASGPFTLSFQTLAGTQVEFDPVTFAGGRVAVALGATDTYLAYLDAPSQELVWLTLGSPTPQPVFPGLTTASNPTLYFDTGTFFLHLFFEDTDQLFHSVLDTTAAIPSWGSAELVTALIEGLEDVPEVNVSGLPLNGPVEDLSGAVEVTLFGGHFQLLYESAQPSGGIRPTHLTIPIDPSGGLDLSRASRELFFDGSAGSGIGLLHSSGAVVALWENVSLGTLSFMRKRSE